MAAKMMRASTTRPNMKRPRCVNLRSCGSGGFTGVNFAKDATHERG